MLEKEPQPLTFKDSSLDRRKKQLATLSRLGLLKCVATSDGITYEITEAGVQYLEQDLEHGMLKEAEHVLDSQEASLVARRRISKDEITVVLPTLNEADAIVAVIDELRKEGYGKILVVDGYSTDGTPELAKERGVGVIDQVGSGKTGAIAAAVDWVSTPYMLVMDADYTYDPASIERLLSHANGYDEIIGARRDGLNHIPFFNRFGNGILSWVFRMLFSTCVRDVCSGMYLLRTETAKQLHYSTAGFDAEVEIVAQVAAYGKITEVPINYRARMGKQKLSPIKDGIRIAKSILYVAQAYNPVFLYSAIMALALLPATITLGWVLYERLVTNIWHSGYALFGTMLFLFASQSMSVAALSMLLKRSEQRMKRDSCPVLFHTHSEFPRHREKP